MQIEIPIPKGKRNDTLFKLGETLVQRGMGPMQMYLYLHTTNRYLCEEPLGDRELLNISSHI